MKHPEISKVRIVGSEALKEELESIGLKTTGCQDLEEFKDTTITIDTFNNYKLDEDVGAVLVGLDQDYTYTKLCLASLYIQTGKAKFITTNEEHFHLVPVASPPDPDQKGDKMITLGKYPGAGAIVEAIQLSLNNDEGS